MSQNNSIEFLSAMENFAVMFPNLDAEVIEEILRINRGSVEKTIDQLLTIASDNQCESFQDDIPSLKGEDSKTKSAVNAESNAFKSKGKWNPVLLKDLDQNFLRITHESEFCDENVVQLLQNEEFLAELRFNQEFLSTLDTEQGRVDKPLEERLKNMGKVSRRKFQQLAKIFTFQRKKSSSQKLKSSKLLSEFSDDEAKK